MGIEQNMIEFRDRLYQFHESNHLIHEINRELALEVRANASAVVSTVSKAAAIVLKAKRQPNPTIHFNASHKFE